MSSQINKAPGVRFLSLLAGILMLLGSVSFAMAGQFGTRCQRSYEANWQTTLPYAWARCGGFNNELDDTDTRDFYFNLVGSTCGFSTCDDHQPAGGVDTVDLFYVSTHGGTTATDAVLTMWDNGSEVISSAWRYGDDDDQVAIFSQYACDTLQNRDGNIWARWDSVFRGGVHIVTGSDDKLWDSITTDEVGEDYADGLQKRKSVKNAWFDGNSDWWPSQDLKVMTVGRTLAECVSRKDGITWQNFPSFPRLRDGNMGWWCTTRITG